MNLHHQIYDALDHWVHTASGQCSCGETGLQDPDKIKWHLVDSILAVIYPPPNPDGRVWTADMVVSMINRAGGGWSGAQAVADAHNKYVPWCPVCGPGYRLGQDGCKHGNFT